MRWPGRVLWGLGEAAVTFGVVVLLLVAHQLWWTNVRAQAVAQRQVAELRREWDGGAGAATEAGGGIPAASASPTRPSAETSGQSTPSPAATRAASQAYAVLRIPRIGVAAPVAQGVSKAKVLNHGYVGHYPDTAQPGQAGNFAVAGHRNTHGEPFRRVDRLRAGDTLIVETAAARFTYVVVKTLPRTSPDDGTVIAPVPYSSVHPQARMKERGYYITLTTCTPEFTSRYRLVVWGQLKAAEPR